MNYCATGSLERLFISEIHKPNERHWVDITMSEDTPTFSVTCCCDDEWIWEFDYDKTNYDCVKHVIMDCIFDAEDMFELIYALDAAFEECFDDIAVNEIELEEDEFECDGDCANCGLNERN